jgi:hypothetical protein
LPDLNLNLKVRFTKGLALALTPSDPVHEVRARFGPVQDLALFGFIRIILYYIIIIIIYKIYYLQ